MKKWILLFALSFSLASYAEEDLDITVPEEEVSEEEQGYKYAIKNFFSKRKEKLSAYADYTHIFYLSVGGAFFRESTEKKYSFLSNSLLSYRQKLKEIFSAGDISLQLSLGSAFLEQQRATYIEISSQISIPAQRITFPMYFGGGLGMGMYPYYVLRSKPSLFLSSEIFAGIQFFDVYENLGFYMETSFRYSLPLKELNVYLETLVKAGIIFRF